MDFAKISVESIFEDVIDSQTKSMAPLARDLAACNP